MTKRIKRCIALILCALMIFTFVACGSEVSNKEKIVVKIACLSVYEPVALWVGDYFEAQGYDYTVETILFDANNQPAVALMSGDVDGLIHNHLPWIVTFNEENGSDLQMPEPHMFYGRNAIYSAKYKAIDELPQDAMIAVPNDAVNMERSLLILQEVGLIALGEKQEVYYNWLDVIDNPRNISLVEVEITQMARVVDDVDALVAYANRIESAGYDPEDYIFEDPAVVDYPIGLVVRGEDMDLEWVQLFQDAFQSEEVKEEFRNQYKGTYVLYVDREN